MKTTLLKTIQLVAGIVMIASGANAETWKCSANGLVNGSYDGGGTAYVHLSGFPSGGHYPVNKKGKTASGVTANGTPFTCKAN